MKTNMAGHRGVTQHVLKTFNKLISLRKDREIRVSEGKITKTLTNYEGIYRSNKPEFYSEGSGELHTSVHVRFYFPEYSTICSALFGQLKVYHFEREEQHNGDMRRTLEKLPLRL